MTLVMLKNRCAIPVSGDIVQWKDDFLKIYDGGILKGEYRAEDVAGYNFVDDDEYEDYDYEDDDNEDKLW